MGNERKEIGAATDVEQCQRTINALKLERDAMAKRADAGDAVGERRLPEVDQQIGIYEKQLQGLRRSAVDSLG